MGHRASSGNLKSRESGASPCILNNYTVLLQVPGKSWPMGRIRRTLVTNSQPINISHCESTAKLGNVSATGWAEQRSEVESSEHPITSLWIKGWLPVSRSTAKHKTGVQLHRDRKLNQIAGELDRVPLPKKEYGKPEISFIQSQYL